MRSLGLVVNPIAGMGGRVGLKGTDGEDIIERARQLGAKPQAPGKAKLALMALKASGIPHEILTVSGEMGESEALACGLCPKVVRTVSCGRTSASDTQEAVKAMVERGVDLVFFVGGDGTARDVLSALGSEVPGLGVPAGVKIHSAVFGRTPRDAGLLAASFLSGRTTLTRQAEVMDIDEAAFREGRVSAALYGFMRVPYEPRLIQGMKVGRAGDDESQVRAIAHYIVENMDDDVYYVIGPGTTAKAITQALGFDTNLLGVDVIANRALVRADVNEDELLGILHHRKGKLVVGVIGGQGYIFGRGNHQISPRVLRAVGIENIVVVATVEKITTLHGEPLLVDTGDEELDSLLKGYRRVITGYKEESILRVA